MISLAATLTEIVANAFKQCGFDKEYGRVSFSKTDFCQFQCNGSFAAAKKYKTNPLKIAEKVKDKLLEEASFFMAEVVPPAFININLTDEYLAQVASETLKADRLGVEKTKNPFKIIIDYGGPNVAKPLHVGHLRSAIIGESIKRISRFVGHEVIGDVHLGDWGLQMGMIIAFLKKDQPELPYFNSDNPADSNLAAPFNINDLELIYPQASALSKKDPDFLSKARIATVELQNGNPQYLLLWKHILEVSIKDLKLNYEKLDVVFDEWKGESDSQPFIPPLIEKMVSEGHAYRSQGALVVDVSDPSDKSELPPLILNKSDGGVLYSTTDLATILQRKADYKADYILYVVDKRQAIHFKQVFRCAYKTGIADENLKLEHIPFGTMNGKDGKPFKTREGGVMKLSTLTNRLIEEATERLEHIVKSSIVDEVEKKEVGSIVGIAALKFGDLINTRTSDYVFDIEKFCSFEGKTGPYILYSVVRIKSILAKAKSRDISWSKILKPRTDVERKLLLKIFEFQDILNSSFEKRLPSLIAEYAYSLSNLYNSFYHENHVMNETDTGRQGSLLATMELSLKTLETCLELLGIQRPERM